MEQKVVLSRGKLINQFEKKVSHFDEAIVSKISFQILTDENLSISEQPVVLC
jgi:hypothetical protein